MAFHVGQLVEYLDRYGDGHFAEPPLTKGTVCTITAVGVGAAGIGVLVAESNVPPEYSGFHPEAFRPLTDSRLAVFRKLLAPSPKHEREPA